MSHFVDTNMACYAFSTDDRSRQAIKLLRGATISVQVLNELTNVSRRKWRYSWDETAQAVRFVESLVMNVRPVDLATHNMGRQLAERYQLNVYDGFIVGAALLADCDTLFSEDMQDGLVIENRLTIRNPFA
jgi:predicted nucleic acid-binding protein